MDDTGIVIGLILFISTAVFLFVDLSNETSLAAESSTGAATLSLNFANIFYAAGILVALVTLVMLTTQDLVIKIS